MKREHEISKSYTVEDFNTLIHISDLEEVCLEEIRKIVPGIGYNTHDFMFRIVEANGNCIHVEYWCELVYEDDDEDMYDEDDDEIEETDEDGE